MDFLSTKNCNAPQVLSPAVSLVTNFSSGINGWEIDSSFLIQDLLPSKSVVMFTAPSQSYKTFILISMAIHLCLNKNYGPLQVKNRYSNFIFSGEGNSSLKRRIRAATISAGVNDIPNLHTDAGAYDFMNVTTIQSLAYDINAIAKADDNPIGIIAIDTFSAHTNIDENNSAQVAQFIKNCYLLSELTESSVFVVHHTGKDRKGYRGSYAFEANVDALIEVKCKKLDSMQAELNVVKMKDGSNKPHLFLNLKSTELGIKNSYGEPVTSLCVETIQRVSNPTQESSSKATGDDKKTKLPPQNQRLKDAQFIASQLEEGGNWIDSTLLSKSLSDHASSTTKSDLNSRYFRAINYLVSSSIVEKKGTRQCAKYRLINVVSNTSNYQLPLPLPSGE
ncbi:MAG: hypothetical protein CL579_00170 [Alteromonadaceae bacterium]|nr:hypothetical protein [Alteromonadaceae bacterium]MBB17891.1 hypothetical protein [Rickettsiales bacterium]